ncbi:MAG: tryptophan-rich sensory protein [Chlorobium sp.]|uniref:TspO/MBR family protein n=1 Tax=Chlorobium sp. TaxID=1095 RepID=UPI0025C202D7|nr:TspO/MBR family protein [Chlorobium sp.]MCF8382705.1 tryptophan-rich sensory protein [Chlorobium sp.]
MATWYDNLKKPRFTPPKTVFGPVWTVLYIFIFSALIVYFLSPAKSNLIPATFFLLIHFSASFSWTRLFFDRKNILLALLDILVIDLTLIVVMTMFFQVNTLAGMLLVPYLGWGLFAAYINWGIYRLNPDDKKLKQ